MSYLFPFNRILHNMEVVLYGAGIVGQDFFAQIDTLKYCKLVGWVDKNWEYYKKAGLPVEAPDQIKQLHYDRIVIAVLDPKTADSIRRDLTKYCDEASVIWDTYVMTSPVKKVSSKKEFTHNDRKCSPNKLVSADQLDLAIRYLLCKDIVFKVENQEHLNLYMRYWMIISNLHEKGLGDNIEKIGDEIFIQSFRELVQTMRQEGFYRDNPILVDEQNKIINGKHRCATALALEEEIWTRQYKGVKGNRRDCQWFYKNGFSVGDMQRILYEFSEIYMNCNIILLFGPIKDCWEMIQNQFDRYVRVVGWIDLDFRNDYPGYENLIHDIYNDAAWDDPWKDRKLRLLKFSPLILRVLLVSDERNKSDDIYEKTDAVKKKLRNLFLLELGDRKDNISIHAADCPEEYIRLRDIFLSSNNLKHNSMRVLRSYRQEFLHRLKVLKEYLVMMKIPKESICIVGSAGLEVFGLRDAEDIDFIILPEQRYKLDNPEIPLPRGIEPVAENNIMIEEGTLITDEQIISCESLHYIFYELKFLNMDILRKRYMFKSKISEDYKAKCDVELLDMFFNYVKWFDDRKMLQLQLEHEASKGRRRD